MARERGESDEPIEGDRDPLSEDLPGGDQRVRLPREDGEDRADQGQASSKLGVDREDAFDDEGRPLDQLGMARRHTRSLERRLGRMTRDNLHLLERVRGLEDQQTRLTRNALQTDLRSATDSVEAAEQRLIQARDDGDRKAELAAESDLATARGRVALLERAVSSTAEDRDPAADRQGERRQQEAEELARDWGKRNPWYGRPEALEDSEIVRAVSVAIANDPENPLPINDPDHFEELDRRLKRRLPERYERERYDQDARRRDREKDEDMDEQPDVAGTRGSSRRAPISRGDGGGNELPETLTRRQIAVYERMGFNWNNKEDREKIVAQERGLVEERRNRSPRHG